ncbi:MAG: alpha/beta fold hydrolase [Pseudomonadota bacterium]
MLRKGYVDSSIGQLHYRERPGPGHAAIYLHQTASSSRMWERVISTLPGERRHIALDTPGFGGSADPDGMPAMPDYAGWLLEAIDGCDIGEFDLVGHHTGACIAVEIAAAAPERLRSLAMIGPVPLEPAEREEFRRHYSTPISPTADGQYLLDTWNYLEGLGADSELELHHRELLDTARAHGRDSRGVVAPVFEAL